MIQNKGPNGDLQLEHKKTTNMTTTDPIIHVDNQAQSILNRLRREPSFRCLRTDYRPAIKERNKIINRILGNNHACSLPQNNSRCNLPQNTHIVKLLKTAETVVFNSFTT